MKRFLIIGLGNPGDEYRETRHNIGFQVLDHLAERSSTSFSSARYGEIAEWRFKGRQIRLLKPNTYMNLSGKAARYHLQDLGIGLEDLLIITDEIALPFGKTRLRGNGSDGGHNGMKSLIDLLGSNAFPRLRVGIGNDYPKGQQVQYVLGQWTTEEGEALPALMEKCTQCVERLVLDGLSRAMTQCNR